MSSLTKRNGAKSNGYRYNGSRSFDCARYTRFAQDDSREKRMTGKNVNGRYSTLKPLPLPTLRLSEGRTNLFVLPSWSNEKRRMSIKGRGLGGNVSINCIVYDAKKPADRKDLPAACPRNGALSYATLRVTPPCLDFSITTLSPSWSLPSIMRVARGSSTSSVTVRRNARTPYLDS